MQFNGSISQLARQIVLPRTRPFNRVFLTRIGAMIKDCDKFLGDCTEFNNANKLQIRREVGQADGFEGLDISVVIGERKKLSLSAKPRLSEK